MVENKTNKFKKLIAKAFNRYLLAHYFTIVGTFSAIVTLISFFVTAKETPLGEKGCATCFIAILIIIYLVLLYHAFTMHSIELIINNTNIEICTGDIFTNYDKPCDNSKSELSVISFNEYFDLTFENKIVSPETLHGMYLERIIQDQKLDILRTQITSNPFINSRHNFTDTSSRIPGNSRKYKLGSIVEFDSYILVAFSKFSKNNEAELYADEYMLALMNFWKNLETIYSGRTVNIPLLGAGITRFRNGKPSKQALLETLLLSLKISGFRNTYSNKKIRFIITPGDMKELDLYSIIHNPIFKS